MSKKWKFIAAIPLIAIITLFADDENVHACLCVRTPGPNTAFENSVAVFRGELIEISGLFIKCPAPESGYFVAPMVVAEFKVETVWKGELNETTFITTYSSNGSCGSYDYFRGWRFDVETGWEYETWPEIGEKYIVYAYEVEGVLWVGLCGRGYRSVPNAQEDLEFLGEGWSPEPGSSDPTPIPPPEPREEQCPIPTPDPSAELSKPEALPATGGCAPLLAHTRLSLDATPLLLAVGIIWLTTRTRRRR